MKCASRKRDQRKLSKMYPSIPILIVSCLLSTVNANEAKLEFSYGKLKPWGSVTFQAGETLGWKLLQYFKNVRIFLTYFLLLISRDSHSKYICSDPCVASRFPFRNVCKRLKSSLYNQETKQKFLNSRCFGSIFHQCGWASSFNSMPTLTYIHLLPATLKSWFIL